MPSKTRRAPVGSWVRMGPAPFFATCDRCGEHVAAPPLPCELGAFVKYLAYAVAAHKNCREVVDAAKT